jgi:hypothetical protein
VEPGPSASQARESTAHLTTISDETGSQDKFSPSKWQISGVVDLDYIKSMPLILSRTPPSWLWFQERQIGSWVTDTDAPLPRPLLPEEQQVKDHFDQIMSNACPDYLDHAYGRGWWLRRLVRVAITGLSSSWYEDAAEKLEHQWNAYFAASGVTVARDDPYMSDTDAESEEESDDESNKSIAVVDNDAFDKVTLSEIILEDE